MQLKQYAATGQKAWIEFLPSFFAYVGLFILSTFLYKKHLLVFILTAFLTSLFNMRLFSIFHDCSHRSFHPSRKVSLWLGRFCGVLFFAPFSAWTRTHISHHANLNNLDKKLPGDILVFTVNEFKHLPLWKKICYRIYRHPVFLLGIAGFIYFLLLTRFPWNFPKEDRKSIYSTNLAVSIFILIGCLCLKTENFLVTQGLVLWMTTVMGTLIFYIHHQFEDSYFSRGAQWNLNETSLKGSSDFHFPPIIQWFTMNVGHHHIHHLHPQVPGYYLPVLASSFNLNVSVKKLGLKEVLGCFKLKLFCEKKSKLVSFKEALQSDEIIFKVPLR